MYIIVVDLRYSPTALKSSSNCFDGNRMKSTLAG